MDWRVQTATDGTRIGLTSGQKSDHVMMGRVEIGIERLVPGSVGEITDHQTDLPRIAKDPKATADIEAALSQLNTSHRLYCGDSRALDFLPSNSIHLILTSPPYWTLKKYRDAPGQLGHVEGYDQFLHDLDEVWGHCLRCLVPGGRLVCVVGDVCRSRRENNGEHMVVPLHSSIQEHCRSLGFANLAPIIWHKIANAAYESDRNGGGFLGKPYEPNSVIKNDIEYILMLRKPGGYRSPSLSTRIMSVIPADKHKTWFQQIWTGVTGASTKDHPAPFPVELAERLVRMFSFVGDTVLDPFLGTGTTSLVALKTGRNSIGVEIDPQYLAYAEKRIERETSGLFRRATITRQ
ncbi:MAG TPA: site-specific DNA-methyltransferase [Micropepsaceae bacterium]|nr:site-specific DNA-methyltransferase [Micropepsaceae bacterium]